MIRIMLSSRLLTPFKKSIPLRLISRKFCTPNYPAEKIKLGRYITSRALINQTSRSSACFNYNNKRLFCSQRKSDEEDDPESSLNENLYQNHLPATVAIPEVWPHVPVIAMKRNPVFPRFMKILEVIFIKNEIETEKY